MNPLWNERTRLLAAALDRASTACFTVGLATPLAGWVYDVGALRSGLPVGKLLVGLLGWFLAAVALHIAAQMILGRVRP